MLLIIDLYVRYGRFQSQLHTVTHNPLYDILRRRHRTREWPSLFWFFFFLSYFWIRSYLSS